MRPYGLGGMPCCEGAISLHVRPASMLRYSPLPETAFGPLPPERKVQPWRRKSQRPAIRTSGLEGSIATLPQPVDRLDPFNTSDQDLPPSAVLYTPRSAESLQSFPGTQAYTVSEERGSTMIFATRSDS